jgi:hypothetical protein
MNIILLPDVLYYYIIDFLSIRDSLRMNCLSKKIKKYDIKLIKKTSNRNSYLFTNSVNTSPTQFHENYFDISIIKNYEYISYRFELPYDEEEKNPLNCIVKHKNRKKIKFSNKTIFYF